MAADRWALSRQEKVIVAFGHSTFFKELMGGQHRRLRNGEMLEIQL